MFYNCIKSATGSNVVKGNDKEGYTYITPSKVEDGRAEDILKATIQEYKVEFSYMDILEDPDVRATLPSVSDWPTFPQLFVKGELIGGCDIITEMHQSDELKAVLFD